MRLTSPAFDNEGMIPQKYACDGENINPPLSFEDVPRSARSLVLIMDDPDVPRSVRPEGIFDHWIVYNIPPSVSGTIEGGGSPGDLGQGTAGNLGYMGPCPPDREHRYFFNLYALDSDLRVQENPTKGEVMVAMEDHIIDQATLMGRYDKKKWSASGS